MRFPLQLIDYIRGRALPLYLLSDVGRIGWLVLRRLVRFAPALLACVLVAVIFPLPAADTPLLADSELAALSDITPDALPQERCLNLSKRVLLRLEQAEQGESDPWNRDDIRIAWITVFYASQGNSQPHVDATYRVLGVHPDKVWAKIVAFRKAMLGPEYETVLASLIQRSPKKPCASVREFPSPRNSKPKKRAS